MVRFVIYYIIIFVEFIIITYSLITNNQWFEESFSTGVLAREFDKTTYFRAWLIRKKLVFEANSRCNG